MDVPSERNMGLEQGSRMDMPMTVMWFTLMTERKG